MEPTQIVKRDGRVVAFDVRRVAAAVGRCLRAERVDADPERVAALAVQMLPPSCEQPTVEQMQDAVEAALISCGQRGAARAYMSFRDDRAAERAALTPEVRRAFAKGAEALGGHPLRVFQFFDKYSRFDDEKGRRETWPEAVRRAVDHLRWLVARECGSADAVPAQVWASLELAILRQEAMPSMRLLAMAGPAARRDDTVLFNCAYQAIDDLGCFRESLIISMAGCGDAYSVESRFVRQLPFVRHQRQGTAPDLFEVPDTSEGWADALHFGLERWFDGHDARFDYSAVRQKGSRMRTKGGRTSGPGVLRDMLRDIRALVLSRQGSALRPVDVNDLLCLTGEAGNSGGQRRTAKLSLSDWGDSEMRDAKSSGRWWETHPYRQNANNSAVWPDEGPTQLELAEQMLAMFRGRSGERGIFSRANALRTMPAGRAEYLRRNGGASNLGTNPCGEIYLQSRSFCNLSQAVARPGDDLETLERKQRAAAWLGTIQSLATRYASLRPEWGRHAEEERLLGVDVTGQADCEILRDPRTAPRALEHLRQVAVETNSEAAAVLGIRPSLSVTANKPAGNSGAFLGCGPGMQGHKMHHGIRNVRVEAGGPMHRTLARSGVPMDPENGQDAATATKWVAHFPLAAPEGSLVCSDMTALEQLDRWLLCKRHYTTHNPSVTVEYGPEEMLDVLRWVWDHRAEIGGISFLPREDTVYAQLPFERTSREEYERALAAFPEVDWAMMAAFDRDDRTEAARELACSAAGGC